MPQRRRRRALRRLRAGKLHTVPDSVLFRSSLPLLLSRSWFLYIRSLSQPGALARATSVVDICTFKCWPFLRVIILDESNPHFLAFLNRAQRKEFSPSPPPQLSGFLRINYYILRTRYVILDCKVLLLTSFTTFYALSLVSAFFFSKLMLFKVIIENNELHSSVLMHICPAHICLSHDTHLLPRVCLLFRVLCLLPPVSLSWPFVLSPSILLLFSLLILIHSRLLSWYALGLMRL